MRSQFACLVALGLLTIVAPNLVARGLVAPALADQKDSRLPGLFEQLMKAPTSDASEQIDEKIWEIWLDSGDPAVDRIMEIGTDAMNAEEYPTALDAFNKIIEQRPDFAEGWNKRATLFYIMGEYEKSLADIARTLQLEPRHFGALSGLGLVSLKLERFEAAAKAYQRVLDIDPMNEGARRNLDAVNDLIKRKSI